MAADDRKRRIMEHLTKSSDGMKFVSPQESIQASPSPVPPPPPEPLPTPPKAEDRKRRIMTHVAISSGDFGNFSLTSEERNRKIKEHVRKSKNEG